MKTVRKINCVLFPYLLTMLGFGLFRFGWLWAGAFVTLLAFLSWFVSIIVFYAYLNDEP